MADSLLWLLYGALALIVSTLASAVRCVHLASGHVHARVIRGSTLELRWRAAAATPVLVPRYLQAALVVYGFHPIQRWRFRHFPGTRLAGRCRDAAGASRGHR